MRFFLRLLSFCILLVLFPFISNAHGYWIELEGTYKVNEPVTVKLFYGDYPEGIRMSGNYLDKMKDIKMFVQQAGAAKQQLEMKQTDDYWVGTFTPLYSGTYEVTGINDQREVQDWTKHNLGITRPIQYLKAYYTVGEQAPIFIATLPLDISLTPAAKESYEVLVKQNGRNVPSQKLTISLFGNEAKDFITDMDGKATMTLDKPGVYILSIDWTDKTPGIFRNKSYETVRYRLDFSLYHR